jgi:hypothetical protein
MTECERDTRGSRKDAAHAIDSARHGSPPSIARCRRGAGVRAGPGDPDLGKWLEEETTAVSLTTAGTTFGLAIAVGVGVLGNASSEALPA